MKIGFQGDWASNSEIAARQFIETFDYGAELVPLISSKNVVRALKNGEIDYGVMAIKNNIGGLVQETKTALTLDLNKIAEIRMQIHHYVFVKNKQIKANDIKFIASHEQALKQSATNLNKIFGNINFVEIEDTALGAKYLANGTFNNEYAVVCGKQAGVLNGLHLLYAKVEDRDSVTTFGLYVKK
ncbi:MAG: hypothetical protein E7375_02250 [Clostridiales bacterium]|nr:hypothetical protein [Clostridiales bacterium]